MKTLLHCHRRILWRVVSSLIAHATKKAKPENITKVNAAIKENHMYHSAGAFQ